MRTKTLLLAGALLAAMAVPGPARAWWFADDGTTWPVFDFHRYGGDVNRPAATPDRPYFHGDDAVPRGLRWRDGEEAAAEAAAEDAAAAAAAAEVSVAIPASPVAVPPVRHPHHARRVRRTCTPAATVSRR